MGGWFLGGRELRKFVPSGEDAEILPSQLRVYCKVHLNHCTSVLSLKWLFKDEAIEVICIWVAGM